MTTAADADVQYGAAAMRLGVGRAFAAFVAELDLADLPEAVRHECKRGVLDWLGCALAGSRHGAVAKLLAGLAVAGSLGRVPVIGRGVQLGPLDAALANGQIGHVLDFDDTHMDGVVLHTSSPVLGALLSLATVVERSGLELMRAYAIGFEAGVRTGKAAPGHHDGGWHLTGTLGSIAAGVAGARFLGLDAEATTNALGIATTQAAGMQQNRGTMSKSLHAGKAAANGVLAALLAREGFDASDEILEGRRGFMRIYSRTSVPEELTRELGRRWEILGNGHKPYACGVVLHPLIDGVIALRGDGLAADAVERIELRVHPHVIRITGVMEPASGLQSKFSLSHAAAVALIDGAAGLAQYTDQRALDPVVAALRGRVTVQAIESYRKDEAEVTIVTRSGERHTRHVDHAAGTRANPMTDARLEAKFRANATPVIGAVRTDALVRAVWALDTLGDVRVLLDLAA